MLRRFRTSVVTLAAVALLTLPVTAFAETDVDNIADQPAPLAVDVFFLRPMGLAMLGVSAVLFVPMAGITAVTRPGELDIVVDKMLREPAAWVFQDPLGSH